MSDNHYNTSREKNIYTKLTVIFVFLTIAQIADNDKDQHDHDIHKSDGRACSFLFPLIDRNIGDCFPTIDRNIGNCSLPDFVPVGQRYLTFIHLPACTGRYMLIVIPPVLIKMIHFVIVPIRHPADPAPSAGNRTSADLTFFQIWHLPFLYPDPLLFTTLPAQTDSHSRANL